MSALEIPYYISEPLRPAAIEVLQHAKAQVFGDTPVRLLPVDKDSTDFHLSNQFLMSYPLASRVVQHRFRTYKESPHPFGPGTLYLDIETHDADLMWNMPLADFFRLGQFAVGDGPVQTTTYLSVVLDAMAAAPGVVAHNGHTFDFSVLLGDEALHWAAESRLFDTMVHASLCLPAPDTYIRRDGRKMINSSKPGAALGWLSLDNLSFQLGLTGKIGDLKALADKYGGYGLIPLDDPEFVQYAHQDVEALRDLTLALVRMYSPRDDYAIREQFSAAIDAQNSRNGFTVDIPAAQARAALLSQRKDEVVADLEQRFGLPTEGTQPWRSNAGKAAIFAALAEHGITPETVPDWPTTAKGAPSLSGQAMLDLTEGTPAEDLGVALAEVMGQRTLAQLALDCVQADGKVHPHISALQRSGRKSTTKPGLTVWSAKDDISVEKSYFVASKGRKLVSADYSNADAKVVAALSGDKDYAHRVEDGVDGHELAGRLVFTGEQVTLDSGEVFQVPHYDDDPKKYRTLSKPLGHGWNYGGQPGKLSGVAKVPLVIAETFVRKMNEAYPDLIAWQNKVRKEGNSGFIENAWGRLMLVDYGRSFTQSPALLGQSGTRELMVDSLIRMYRKDPRMLLWVVAQVHDELVFDIPDEHLEWAVPAIRECMEVWWGPAQKIHFTVSVGEPADTWEHAGH